MRCMAANSARQLYRKQSEWDGLYVLSVKALRRREGYFRVLPIREEREQSPSEANL